MKSIKCLFIFFLVVPIISFPVIIPLKSEIQEKSNYVDVPSFSQSYNSYYINWSGPNDEEGFSVISDLDNNIYVGGYTKSYGAGDEDLLLVKFNSMGHEIWNTTWGGSGRDSGRCVVVDSENNVYLLGITNSFGAGGDDICLLKYNSLGVLEKEIIWGTNESEIAYGMCIDPMDNIYISGCRHYESNNEDKLLVIKFDSNGNQKWNSTDIGGQPKFSGFYAAITYLSSDRIYLFHTLKMQYYVASLCRFDINGSAYNSWVMGGSGSIYSGDIAIDSNNFTYFSLRALGGEDLLIKSNMNFVEIWTKHWMGGLSKETRLAIDSNNRIYLMGHLQKYGFNDTLVCIEFNTEGDQVRYIKWEKEPLVFGRSISIDNLNNVYITGKIEDSSTNTSSVVLIKNMFDINMTDDQLVDENPADDGDFIIRLITLILSGVSLFGIILILLIKRKKRIRTD